MRMVFQRLLPGVLIICIAATCIRAEEYGFRDYDNDPNLARAMEYDSELGRGKAMEYYAEYLKRGDVPSFQRARVYVHMALRYTTLSEPKTPRLEPDPQKAKVYLEKALEAEPERIGHTTIRARTLLASLPVYSPEEQIKKDMEVYGWLLSLSPDKIEKLALPEMPGETGLSDLKRKSLTNYVESVRKATALNIVAEARSMPEAGVWLGRIIEAFPDAEISGMARKELGRSGDIRGKESNGMSTIEPGLWEAGPGIKVKGVWKAHNQDWFHISQSCNLTIDALDEDKIREDGLDGGNHVLPGRCLWYGDNLSRYSGLAVTWQPQRWTEGNRIYALVDDDSELPGGSATDDKAVRTPLVILRAWEAMVTMTGQSLAAVTSEAKVVTETEWAPSVQSASVECSITKGPATIRAAKSGKHETLVIDDDKRGLGRFQANGTWQLSYIPRNAQTWSAIGRCRVSVSVSAELTPPDSGLGLAFASNILDSCEDIRSTRDNSGSGGSKDRSAKCSYSDAEWFAGAFGSERNAVARVYESTKARDGTKGNSSASTTVTGSCTFGCSDVSAENLYLSDEPVLIRGE